MKTFLRLLLALAATAVAAFAQTGTAIPGGTQSTTYIINKPGRYYLAAHRVMTDPHKNAVEIASDDVTLDLNGYTIAFASSSGNASGIYGKDLQNTEIRGGSIVSSPLCGIYINSTDSSLCSSNTRIVDVRTSQAGYGMWLTGNAITVTRCSIDESRISGIKTHGGAGTLIQDCSIDNADEHGIESITKGTLVRNCVVTNSGFWGISILQGGLVENCNVTLANVRNAPLGSGVEAAGKTVVRNNLVSQCTGMGINAYSTNNLVEGNVIISSVSHYAIRAGSTNSGLMIGNRYSANSTIASAPLMTNGGGNIAF